MFQTFTVKNRPYLPSFLDTKNIAYQVLQDGFAIRITTSIDIFNLVAQFQNYCIENDFYTNS